LARQRHRILQDQSTLADVMRARLWQTSEDGERIADKTYIFYSGRLFIARDKQRGSCYMVRPSKTTLSQTLLVPWPSLNFCQLAKWFESHVHRKTSRSGQRRMLVYTFLPNVGGRLLAARDARFSLGGAIAPRGDALPTGSGVAGGASGGV
jgi:hypothetical protein